MAVTPDLVKKLRDETGVSVMLCKKALEDAKGDLDQAKVILRKHSISAAARKADRTLGAGIAAAYTHAGGSVVGAVVLSCETDFVAKNEEFGKLAYDIAMHVAAMDPQFVSRDEVRETDLAAARAVFEREAATLPEQVRMKALQGKIESYIKESTLLDQHFVKNPLITVQGLLEEAMQKFGERIKIVRFARLAAK